MNILYTNHNPFIAAKEHCTIHNRKMIIEYAQMLSTAQRLLDGNNWADECGMYKVTHENHRCNKWVRESKYHYFWLFTCFKELCDIFKENRGKEHATSRLIPFLKFLPENIEDNGFNHPPLAMSEEFKSNSVTVSYRNYLCYKFNDWLTRDKPLKVEWFGDIPEWVK